MKTRIVLILITLLCAAMANAQNSPPCGDCLAEAVTWSSGAGANGHRYAYVHAPGIRWEPARLAALQTNCCGMQGYLATITFPEENAFVTSISDLAAWTDVSAKE